MNPLGRRCRGAIGLTMLLAVIALAGCSGRVELAGAVPEQEANQALTALLAAGIPGEKVPGKEGMVALRVPADQVARAFELLQAQGLPRQRFAGMGEIFRKEGLISSPLEERARYVYALSQELSGTLTQIDGVIAARVHVVLPERSVGGEETAPARAAVFVKHQPQAELDAVQPQIRRLVLNAIPGLTAERVSLVLLPGQPVVAPAGEPAAEGHTPAAFWRRLALVLGALVLLLVVGGAGGALWWWRRARPAAATTTTAGTA